MTEPGEGKCPACGEKLVKLARDKTSRIIKNRFLMLDRTTREAIIGCIGCDAELVVRGDLLIFKSHSVDRSRKPVLPAAS